MLHQIAGRARNDRKLHCHPELDSGSGGGCMRLRVKPAMTGSAGRARNDNKSVLP